MVENKMVTMITEDKKLPDPVKMEYIILANDFMEDFKENMLMTSIELNDRYPYGMDTWQSFLRYPAVSKYIESFRVEIAEKQANEMINTGVRAKDAIAVKQNIANNAGTGNNQNFIVFRLPDKENEYELSGEI